MSKINHHIYYNETVDSIIVDFVYEVALKNLYNADIIYFNIINSGGTFSLTSVAEKNNCIFNTCLLSLHRTYFSFIFYHTENYKKLIKKIYRKIKRYSKNYKLKYKLNIVSINNYN